MVVEKEVPLAETDFFTEFGKRVFKAIFEIVSAGNFDAALLGDYFTPEELGRIMRMQLARRELSDNGVGVFRDSAEALRRETHSADDSDPLGDIRDLINRKRNT